MNARSSGHNRPITLGTPSPQYKHNPTTSTVVTAPVKIPRHLSTCPTAASAARTAAGLATAANGFHPVAASTQVTAGAPGPASTASRSNPGSCTHDDTDPDMTDSANEAPGYQSCA